jgi:hypothetical protein
MSGNYEFASKLISMKYILTAVFFLLVQARSIGQTDSLRYRVLKPEQMTEDFKFLRKILEETHPALYRYTPKEVMQRKMDSIAGSLNAPMAFYDFYRLLASLIADIRCAHTYIIPKKNLGQYFNKEIKMLPFEIIPAGRRLYITVNGTSDTLIHPGFELVSIDGIPVKDVLQRLYRHLWSDGFIETSKKSLTLGSKFGLFYYMMIARPDSFNLGVHDLQGKFLTLKVPAQNTETYRTLLFKNPVNQRLLSLYKEKNEKDQKNGWRLEMLNQPHTALLRINEFGGGRDGKGAVEKMRKFMDESLAKIKKEKVTHLIVDLRNNGGGWDIQGAELFTYLAKDSTPVRYYQRKHTIMDTSEYLRFSDLSPEDIANAKKELIPQKDGTFTLSEDYNDDLKLQYPKANRFTGKIYFLINGGTGSSASEFTAVAYSHRLGTFIGEESGGAYEGDNGGSFLHFELPNSGISAGSVLIYYNNGVRPRELKGRGVIPDYPVQATIEDILEAKDPALQYTLELIKKDKH